MRSNIKTFLTLFITIIFFLGSYLPSSATVLLGLDKENYLTAKLAQLQLADPTTWDNYTSVQLETLLANYGLTVENHYLLYGYSEGLAPNAYFNHSEYILAKATAMYNFGSYNSVLEAQDAFNAAWTQDAYLHYIQYGSAEGINPSNSFDENAYLTDKLNLLKAGGSAWDDKTIDDLRILFDEYGMTVVAHYLLYGQYEGLSPTPVVSDASGSTDTASITKSVTFTSWEVIDQDMTSGEPSFLKAKASANDAASGSAAYMISEGPAPVPEPATMLLFGLGLLGLAGVNRRKK